MSWHSDFKSFTGNLFPLEHRGNKLKIHDSENEAKQNRYEFPSASSIIKCLEDFEKVTGFYKSYCSFFPKNLHIHFNPSQNVSAILLLNGLVMVTNEGSIACKCFKRGNVRGYFLP